MPALALRYGPKAEAISSAGSQATPSASRRVRATDVVFLTVVTREAL